jgi:hypothetical protein
MGMKSSTRRTTQQRLLEYVHMRRLAVPDAVPVVELTATVQYAIDAHLPQTLTALLRELGRRGGLVVSVQPGRQGRNAG